MLKPFSGLMKIDVTPYTKERDKMKYLPWAVCKKLLHDNGAEIVYFEPLTNSNGSSLFMSDIAFTDKNGVVNRCYEVAVKIVIDDKEYIMRSPLMNGANPVKDNSLSQQRVWNAQARAFVKGVAIHTGLGFSLWLDDSDDAIGEMDDEAHSLAVIVSRVKRLYSKAVESAGDEYILLKNLGLRKGDPQKIIEYALKLGAFERALKEYGR